MMRYQYNDGGRKAAGYKGKAGDCVCRCICIVTGKSYQEVYAYLAAGNANQRPSKNEKRGSYSAAQGIDTRRKWFKNYMQSLGFQWVAARMRIDALPKRGRFIADVWNHYTCVINGVLHDNRDWSRGGKRMVYGYYKT